MKKINVAIMGIGVVGGGTYDIITNQNEMFKRTENIDVKVTKVLDKNKEYVEKRTGRKDVYAASLDEILNDDSISIVVETMGGVEPAKTFIEKCLLAGKSVVTANKELIAKHWASLETAAKKGQAGFYFEASCVGGVPVIRTLNESMQANNMQKILGIINGTTNYIITKMSEEGSSYQDALKGAQAAGFAEADPTADVEGFDAMYKLSILSSLAFHTCIPYTSVFREGITKITADDIKNGKELGYTLKLLAIGKRKGNDVEVRVHPTFVPNDHPLASVRNEFNAVFLNGNYVDDIMLYGKGAGSYPTASAIVSDVIFAANASYPKYTDFDNNGKVSQDINISTDFVSKYYIALSALDQPGVLSQITEILGKNDVSINAVTQKGKPVNGSVPIVFLTHKSSEHAVQNSLKAIEKLKGVKSVDSLIRVL